MAAHFLAILVISMQGECGDIVNELRESSADWSGELPPHLYDQLRRLARSLLRGQAEGHTLQPTALVNEAYLKVFGATAPEFSDRVHFLALMARVMRQVLVDYARSRAAFKRGGGRPLALDAEVQAAAAPATDPAGVLDLNLALDQLAAANPDLARVVELYYFGGLTADEIALVLSRSVHIVRHDLRAARAWLRRELSPASPRATQSGSAD